jgi:hypothetical protein
VSLAVGSRMAVTVLWFSVFLFLFDGMNFGKIIEKCRKNQKKVNGDLLESLKLDLCIGVKIC